MFGMVFPHMSSEFSTSYNCYSHSCTPGKPRDDIKDGGKILMPPSALEHLTRLNAQNPMTFKLTNPRTNRSTHCGVLEFVADEGLIFVPYWMMENLGILEGELIHVMSIVLPVATFAKFEPQSESFLDISNPKAVLEFALRKFACLTVDDMIVLTYNDMRFELKVLETQPKNAVRIIECDMSVDFAPPVGYVEKRIMKEKTPCSNEEDNEGLIPEEALGMKVFRGSGCRLDGRGSDPSTSGSSIKIAPSRGVPNFDYKPGSLTFLRVINKPAEGSDDGMFRPFEGPGVRLKQVSRKSVPS